MSEVTIRYLEPIQVTPLMVLWADVARNLYGSKYLVAFVKGSAHKAFRGVFFCLA